MKYQVSARIKGIATGKVSDGLMNNSETNLKYFETETLGQLLALLSTVDWPDNDLIKVVGLTIEEVP